MSSAMETNTAPAATNSMPPVVDVEALLAPIPGDNPAGESLAYSGLYDEIKEARRADDTLEQGDWVRDTKSADWVRAATLATDALTSQTKDLQICAWMTEALTKLYGFAGLRDALKVVHGLHVGFWDTLFPEEDDGDLEGRANAISWMEREAAVALREVPITRGAGGQSYGFNEFEQSNAFNVGPEVSPEVAEERRRRAGEEGKITSEDWLKAKQSTPRAFYEAAHATLDEAWEYFQALDRLLDERYKNQAPAMTELKKALDSVRAAVEKIVKEKRLLEPDPISVGEAAGGEGEAGANGGAPGGGATAGGVFISGPIRTRAEAVSRLTEVAAFFRQTEPHSPVSYLVERSVKWSQMPLEQWLASVIKDDTVLGALRETLGVDLDNSQAEE
ncbi:MAG TPA: type VI secretion system protein TssA [Pyrinomonadaceae bacterium]